MTVDERIAAALADHAPLVALIGDRAYPVTADQATPTPFVTWFEVTRTSEPTHDDIGLGAFITVQFSCWAATAAQAKQVRAEVLAAIAASDIQATAQSGTCFRDPNTLLYHATVDLSVADFVTA